MRSTPRKSSPTRREWNCSARPASNSQLEPELRRHRHHLAWRLHHLARNSSTESSKLINAIPACTIFCSISISPTSSPEDPAQLARRVSPPRSNMASPCLHFSASLGYFDSYRSARLPSNLLQAQRDFFGAHTYERVDKPGVFHTEWIESEHNTAENRPNQRPPTPHHAGE